MEKANAADPAKAVEQAVTHDPAARHHATSCARRVSLSMHKRSVVVPARRRFSDQNPQAPSVPGSTAKTTAMALIPLMDR
jgi:hypothetical protein